MYYGNIKEFSIENGPGIRVSLFVSGCRNHCEGCFSPHTWNFEYGEPFTDETLNSLIRMLKPDYIQGISILGGEPMEPENQKELVRIVRAIRTACPGKDIWIYSGFVFEELMGESRGRCECTDELLSMVDVLVDGRFEQAKRNLSLAFRGSENQRILDMRQSLNKQTATPWREEVQHDGL